MARIKCPKCDFINEEGRPACSRCGTVLPLVKIQAKGPPPPPERRHPQMRQLQFQRGQVIAGRYTVLNMIGRGGMGCIYHVRDNALHEEVALKMLLPQFVRDKMVVERFFNEARIARALSHPNIVRVHDIGVTGEIIYISMELIRGKSLRSMLEYSIADDHIPYKQALKITDELCDALEYAHRHTIHRDIKPENVMVCDDGTVKLMDFGISKLMDSSRMTGTSIIMGTPMYMSPEQLRNSANVDARADIYSIGVMLYEIITGNLPTSLSKPASQITRGTPAAIDAIVAKCVEPDPGKRFQSATELRDALRPLISEQKPARSRRTRTTTSWDVEGPARGGRWVRRVVGGLLVGVILALTATGLYTLEVARRTRIKDILTAAALPPPERDPARMFRQISELRDRLRERLAEQSGRNGLEASFLQQADAAWEEAAGMAEQDPEGAVERARVALQAYAGPLTTPPGMVFVPPGEVLAGGSIAPVEGFFIDATEVTVGEYRQFCIDADWPYPYNLNLDAMPRELPIYFVTFYDALAFAAQAGKGLPTERQWARAAHGDAALAYPWESAAEWPDHGANMRGSEDGFEYTAPVGSFEADRSWVGCYDMAGNVAEWTRSVWGPLPYDADGGREDLAEVNFGTQLTVRGGSFNDQGNLQSRAPLYFEGPRAAEIGFRCVINMPETLEGIEAMAEKALSGE